LILFILQIYYYDPHNRLIPFILLLPNERRGINTFESTRWVAKDDKTNTVLHLNGRIDHVTRINSPDNRLGLTITVPRMCFFCFSL